MTNALVIIHAGHPNLGGKGKDKTKNECLKDLIHAEACRFLEDDNNVYYLPPSKFEVPDYLMDLFNDLIVVEGIGRRHGYAAQEIELKQMLIEQKTHEAVLAGVHYAICVKSLHSLLSSPEEYFMQGQMEYILMDVSKGREEGVKSEVIPAVKSGLLTNFMVDHYRLDDGEFLAKAGRYGMHASLDDKKLFRQMVKMKKAMGQ